MKSKLSTAFILANMNGEFNFYSFNIQVIPWLKKIIWVIGVPVKDCCYWLTFWQPVRKPSSESSTTTWLWRWLAQRLSKRQSITTVLLRTPITQMIFFQSRYATPGFKPFSYPSYCYLWRWAKSRTWRVLLVNCWILIQRKDLILFSNPIPPTPPPCRNLRNTYMRTRCQGSVIVLPGDRWFTAINPQINQSTTSKYVNQSINQSINQSMN